MRIKSNFKDYYDISQSFDKTETLYVREENLFVKKHNREFLRAGYLSEAQYSVDAVLGYIGFCGYLYPYAKVKDRTFYNAEDLMNFIKDLGVEEKTSRFISSVYLHLNYRKEVENFFNKKPSILSNLFHEHNCPVFNYELGKENDRLFVNPSLKEMKFMTIKDPYQAYQDISTFVSGVLNNKENPMILISDTDKLAKHGFDKWSFRKKGKNSR